MQQMTRIRLAVVSSMSSSKSREKTKNRRTTCYWTKSRSVDFWSTGEGIIPFRSVTPAGSCSPTPSYKELLAVKVVGWPFYRPIMIMKSRISIIRFSNFESWNTSSTERTRVYQMLVPPDRIHQRSSDRSKLRFKGVLRSAWRAEKVSIVLDFEFLPSFCLVSFQTKS